VNPAIGIDGSPGSVGKLFWWGFLVYFLSVWDSFRESWFGFSEIGPETLFWSICIASDAESVSGKFDDFQRRAWLCWRNFHLPEITFGFFSIGGVGKVSCRAYSRCRVVLCLGKFVETFLYKPTATALASASALALAPPSPDLLSLLLFSTFLGVSFLPEAFWSLSFVFPLLSDDIGDWAISIGFCEVARNVAGANTYGKQK